MWLVKWRFALAAWRGTPVGSKIGRKSGTELGLLRCAIWQTLLSDANVVTCDHSVIESDGAFALGRGYGAFILARFGMENPCRLIPVHFNPVWIARL